MKYLVTLSPLPKRGDWSGIQHTFVQTPALSEWMIQIHSRNPKS